MSEQYTQEPMFQYEFDQLARYENGRVPVLLTEKQYNRARACVNACAGIATEHLEQGAGKRFTRDILLRMASLQKQRDELLAALEKITDESVCLKSEIVEKARSAIASAKGGA